MNYCREPWNIEPREPAPDSPRRETIAARIVAPDGAVVHDGEVSLVIIDPRERSNEPGVYERCGEWSAENQLTVPVFEPAWQPYRLVTNDGRTGFMLFTGVDDPFHPTTMFWKGTGAIR